MRTSINDNCHKRDCKRHYTHILNKKNSFPTRQVPETVQGKKKFIERCNTGIYIE